MLRIRLKRTGRRHDPSYRLVVVESSRSPKSGHYVENLGLYNPRSDTKQINTERAQLWLSRGAQASGTAHNILVDLGIQTGVKMNVLPHKSPITPESNEEKPTSESQGDNSSSETQQDTKVNKSASEKEPKPDTAEEKEAETAEEDSSNKNETQAVQ